LISRFFQTGKAKRRVYLAACVLFLIVLAAYFYVVSSLAGLR
jgi:hypothetical protein